MTFYGRIERGQILLSQDQAFARQRETLNGRPIELILRKERRRRDPQQNYYWGVVVRAFAEALHRPPKDVDFALRIHFMPAERSGPLAFWHSPADLDKLQFSRYVDQCLDLAAEMRIYIPTPAPQFVEDCA